jgi:hypothetical protein
MMAAFHVATMLIASTGDANIINVRRYCARSKMKRRASSLGSRMHLFGMDIGDSI